METCIFCKIIDKKINAATIFEDQLIKVIMDIDPINKGHMLIIPKAHKLDLDELTEDESTRIMQVSKLLVKVLKRHYKCDGYSIMQNGGLFNDVGHYHMHVFPRFKDDGFGWKFGACELNDIKEIATALRAGLDTVL